MPKSKFKLFVILERSAAER